MVTILMKLVKRSGEVSGEEEERAVEQVTSLLKDARKIGQEHASQNRILIGFDPQALARSIVRNYIKRVKDRIVEIFHPSPPPESPPSEDEQWQSFDDWAATLADTVAHTEIPASIEQGVRDSLLEQDERQMVWKVQDGACKLCQINADFGPIDVGDVFPSGDEFPPAHPYCRCSLGVP